MKTLSNRLVLGAFLVLSPIAAASAQDQQSPQARINQFFQTSFQALNHGELEKAESDTREILGLALDQLGVIYAALHDFERAEKAYQEAIRSSVGGASNALFGLAVLYLRTGQYDKGIETINQILAINPLHPEARHVLGKIYFLQGRFADAASQLQDSYRTRPGDVSVAYTLALAYLKQQRPKPAAAVFDSMKEALGDSAPLRLLFGRAYRETGYYEEAIRELKAAIEMQPDLPRAHHYLALTYLLLEEGASGFPEAEVELRKELEIQPDDYFPNFFLGVILTATRRNLEAIEHLKRALVAQPDNPDPYLQLGQAWFQEGNFTAAVQALEKCLELTNDPSRNDYQIAKAHYVLGRSYLKLGEREQAAHHIRQSEAFKKLLSEVEERQMQAHIKGLPPELGALGGLEESLVADQKAMVLDAPEPDDDAKAVLQSTADFYLAATGNAYQQMARIMTSKGRLQRAVQYLEKAVFWQPETPGAALNLAIARIKADQPAEAVQPLIQEIQRGDSVEDARRLLADVALLLVERRQREPAQKAVDFLLDTNPKVPELHLLKGHLQAQGGNFNQALVAYQKALELSPELPEAHFNAGTVLVRLGRMDEALVEFEAELRRDPKHAKALYHKAFILAARRQYEEAAPLLRQVLRLAPRYADAYYQLGKIQLEQGKLLLATANLETAAHYSPRAAHVYYQLSRAYTQAGRQEDAQRALQTYQQLKRAQEAPVRP